MQILHGHKMTMYCSVKCLPRSQGYNYYIVRLLSLPVLHTINKLSEFPDLLFHAAAGSTSVTACAKFVLLLLCSS